MLLPKKILLPFFFFWENMNMMRINNHVFTFCCPSFRYFNFNKRELFLFVVFRIRSPWPSFQVFQTDVNIKQEKLNFTCRGSLNRFAVSLQCKVTLTGLILCCHSVTFNKSRSEIQVNVANYCFSKNTHECAQVLGTYIVKLFLKKMTPM